MIVRQRYSWFRMLLIWNGSVLPAILPRLLIVFALSIVVVIFHGQLFDLKIPLNPAPFTLIGIALAVFLGFRNSAGYDRFWEGRKLWGALLNDTRSFMRQTATQTTLPANSPELTTVRELLTALVFSLKHQLRATDASMDLQRILPGKTAALLSAKKYKAAFTLRLLGDWLRTRRDRGELTEGALYGFDTSLMRMSDSIGGCERIAGTPIPYPYTILLHRTVYIYCLLLPFGLVDNIGWATPIFAVFIAYTFIALDEVVTQIEEPFGFDENDLPLDALSEIIEISVREMAGEETSLSVRQPEHYQLT